MAVRVLTFNTNTKQRTQDLRDFDRRFHQRTLLLECFTGILQNKLEQRKDDRLFLANFRTHSNEIILLVDAEVEEIL